MKKFRFAPKQIYDQFGKYFPFSTVDVVVLEKDTFILTKRIIPPYKGLWHLPGGIIRRNEKIENAAIRAVKKELNIDVKIEKFLGVYENPMRTRHDITHCFVASILQGKISSDFQSSSIKFFKRAPIDTIPYHKIMISDAISTMKKKKHDYCTNFIM